MNYTVNDLAWSGNRKILNWDRNNFYELLKQITPGEIETMNTYLDSEGYELKGLSESYEDYIENVLITYIKDWLKLVVDEDSLAMVKDLCNIYCAVMATFL